MTHNNEPKPIFKAGVSDDALKLYEGYLSIVSKQYDLIWSGFRSYALVLSGLLAAVAFIYKGSVDKACYCPTGALSNILITLCIFGALLAFCWLVANNNHWHWEDVKQKAAKSIEAEILLYPKNIGMFHRIYQEDPHGLFTIAQTTKIVIFLILLLWVVAAGYLGFGCAPEPTCIEATGAKPTTEFDPG